MARPSMSFTFAHLTSGRKMQPDDNARFNSTLSANVLDNGWYVNIHCQTHLPKGYRKLIRVFAAMRHGTYGFLACAALPQRHVVPPFSASVSIAAGMNRREKDAGIKERNTDRW